MSADNVRTVLQDLEIFQGKQTEEVQRLRKLSNLLSIGLAVVLIGFIWLFFRTVGGNFTQEQVTASVQKHLPEMLPDLANGTVQIVTRVYPTYADLLEKEAIEGLPELTTVAETQVGLLIEGVHKGAEERLHKAILDSFVGEGKPLRAAFPKLSAEDVTKAVEVFTKDIEQDLVDVTNNVMLAHIGEIVTLKKTMAALDSKDLPNDDVALSKRLVHDLLGLLDIEVQETK